MTISVAGIPTKPFASNSQNTVGKPLSLCRPNTMPPRIISFKIDWSVYGFNVGVTINLVGLGPSQQLDMIKGIAIDNAGCANNVMAVFSDSNFTVPCEAYSVITQKALTAQLNLVVYNLTANASGVTTVYLSNTDLGELVSSQNPFAVIQGAITGTGTVTDTFATGDSNAVLAIALTATGVTPIIPSQGTGFFVITEIEVFLVNCTMNNATAAAWSSYLQWGITILDIYESVITSNIFAPEYTGRIISSRSGLQMRLPANSAINWQNNVALTTGAARVCIEFTWTGL
jgi:hypothetical protein